MNIEFVKRPDNYSTTLFSGESEFSKKVLTENKCIVDLNFMTKTYLSIAVRSGSFAFRMNYDSDYSKANNLTLVEKKDFSYFTGEHTVNKYFKVTKKQNTEVLKNHILSLMDLVFSHFHIHELINKDSFKITVWTPSEGLK
jgi:hypothetical protein